MFNLNYKCLIIILLTIYCVKSQSSHEFHHRKRCSRVLSDALSLLCGKIYNMPSASQFDDSNGPGIVEECCYHACSVSQLEKYCGNPTSNKSEQSQKDT
ncbi:hypothetical protein HCN44_001519 [Aphidius gifuensis]|uniref:Insulin-like domain-containing protein n=1 Tax=Aphidius gifuensis TaxID=684658 RepID=A0A835CQV8_APHGI|nr:insulin-like growth factor III [Aphidius gifuensis]KAF7992194.1 hypothetical protein HCN44_001519 [Aphidius gifuensis]